jgi:hypothetical protein
MQSDHREPGQKQWWAPVWRGLVADTNGKHYQRMKSALWLYLYLLIHANRATGVLLRKISTISADMGIARDSIVRWLGLLRKEGYITTVNTGRCLTIRVERWKPILRGARTQQQPLELCSTRSRKYTIPSSAAIVSNAVQMPGGNGVFGSANNMNIKIMNINNSRASRQTPQPTGGLQNMTTLSVLVQQQMLALDLAIGLNDPNCIVGYRSCCKRY